GRLLRHVDLRGADDVGEDRQLAVALHRLDHRPRPFRRARLGRLRILRGDLLPGAVAVEPQGTLFPPPGELALLDLQPRHRPLHHRDVGGGHPPGPDVARLHLVRLPPIFIRRDRRGDAPLLPDPGARRRDVPRRRAAHGLQHLEDDHRAGVGLAAGGAAQARSGRGRVREFQSMSLWTRHKILETNAIYLLLAALVVISIGGIVEIVPLFYLKNTIEKVDGVRPYTPLELAGRNIYVREGCYNCHSQMIRPLRDEVERYGHYSLAAESMYDRPFQWGSKRTGPDLARVGGKYSDDWHRAHLNAPRSVVPGSIMPSYPWLAATDLDYAHIADDLKVQATLGVPYNAEMIANARA